MEYSSLYSTKRSGNATAFVNGRVYIMNDARPWAEAFIVDADGIFEVIGSNAEIQKIANANRRMLVQYQLRGQFVMPGIHDAHTRLLAAGRQRLGEVYVGWDSDERTLASNISSASRACDYSDIASG